LLAANIGLLGAALGLGLRALSDKAIGEDRIADLFACDEGDGSLVLIENQLELSDDAHVGQIFSYLAGSGAKAMIWIAEGFEPRHLGLIRWLNEATTADYRFFAVRVRVARSEAGGFEPDFDVLESPAQWTPPTRRLGAVSPFGFPATFWDFHLLRHKDEARRSRTVGPRCRWRATKVKGVVIAQLVEDNAAVVFLRGRNGVPLDAAHAALSPFRERLERRLGVSLCGARPALLAAKTLEAQATDPSNWPRLSDWLRDQARDYEAVLRAY